MQLNLQLTKRQRDTALLTMFQQMRQRSEFESFDVDLQDIDKLVIVGRHECLESIELGLVRIGR